VGFSQSGPVEEATGGVFRALKAHTSGPGLRYQSLDEGVAHGILNDDTRIGAADLALVAESEGDD